MKILSRRNGPARTDDVNGDGVVDERDRGDDGRPVITDRDAERTTYRSAATASDGERARDAASTTGDGGATTTRSGRTGDSERRAAERAAAARAATGGRPDVDARPAGPAADVEPATERTVDLNRDGRPDRPVDRDPATERVEPVRTKRPRASLLATLGLIVSVVGALFVLSGTLAGYGIGLGAVGAVLAVLGLVATRRRHVAGKTDALIGIVVGLAAVVLGVVAMTGQFDWPTTDGDWVGRFREWLDSQFADLF
ncbi:thrombospondin [Micromonospora sp. CA-244673]|uniref:thrombospondin n=1 Tax=Micromonospora sp. CA-244673 TaxID=3239958 RepID=UPI003D8E0B7C